MVAACRCGSMRWNCTGRGSGARAFWRVSCMSCHQRFELHLKPAD
jgi:hypothetical protein